jgi:hypothetical protein
LSEKNDYAPTIRFSTFMCRYGDLCRGSVSFFDADPDPDLTFHFNANPDLDPTPNFTHVGKSEIFQTFIRSNVRLLDCFIFLVSATDDIFSTIFVQEIAIFWKKSTL